MSKQRVDWVDTAKGVSIVLVTFLHVVQLSEASGLPVYRLVRLNSYLSQIRMPLFFAVAGVFAGKAIAGSWPSLLRTKVALYAWLILIWSIVRWSMITFVVNNPDNPLEGGQITELAYPFFAPITGIWFLWSLAIFFVLTKVLRALPTMTAVAVAGGISILSVTWQSLDRSAIATFVFDNIAYRNSMLYFVFFVAAALMPQLIFRIGVLSGRWVLPALASSFAILAIARAAPIPIFDGTARLASSVLGVSGVLIASRIVTSNVVGQAFNYLGKNTLAIYVAQIPVICIFMALMHPYVGQAGKLVTAAGTVFVTAMVVLLTLGIQALAKAAGAGWMYRLPRRAGDRDIVATMTKVV
ncbi:acyltransferase family protein [Sphingomonas corticis]|jgi:uncharacterized membrane protein YcfT|uniref:acyltransferase family protein n=1 Tax=Sphingomonas corticis TaxID=2722791 RepID=UPI001EF1279A|nr:acyltransferase family protein [Sphingomonas corticis]